MTTYKDVRKALVQAAIQQKIPLLGEFELTGECNLACEMCYVKEAHRVKGRTTVAWKQTFQEAVEAGMIFALLTGGEVMLRPDFIELYEYLFDLGVRITVFTNGTLLTPQIVESFRKRPPEYVAITLYGASNATYQRITKNPNGFDQLVKGLDLMQQSNITVVLRTIPIRPLAAELDQLIAFAKARKLFMGYALYIGPTRELCHKELGLRMSPAEVVAFEIKMRAAFGLESYQDFTKSEDGFHCAALRSSFFVTWDGFLQPCAMLNHPKKQLVVGELLSTFHQLGDELKSIDSCDDCASCDSSGSCIQCYARRYLEGNANKCPSYLKAIAVLRGERSHG